jgi:hypothetical protein
MVFLWFSYGFPYDFSYGFPMVFLWFSYGNHPTNPTNFLPCQEQRIATLRTGDWSGGQALVPWTPWTTVVTLTLQRCQR